MNWADILKVQVVNTKQGIKTSQRKLPEPDDSNCKDTLRKWVKKANELIAEYKLNFFAKENQDNLDSIPDEMACKAIKIFNDVVKETPISEPRSRHFNLDDSPEYKLNLFVSTPGVYYFNSVPYFHTKISIVKNWKTVYNCGISMHKDDWVNLVKSGNIEGFLNGTKHEAAIKETHLWTGMMMFGREYLDFTK